MSDEPVKECEVCGEPVKRLLFPVAIQFKGSGFYTTDYARKSTISAAGSRAESSGCESSGSDSGSGNGHGHKDHAETASPAAPDSSKSAAPVTKTAS